MAVSGMKAVPLPSSFGVGPGGVATSASRLARAVRSSQSPSSARPPRETCPKESRSWSRTVGTPDSKLVRRWLTTMATLGPGRAFGRGLWATVCSTGSNGGRPAFMSCADGASVERTPTRLRRQLVVPVAALSCHNILGRLAV